MNKNYLFPHRFRIVGWVLFILATLTIYGGVYAIVPYFVFFVFLLLFIVKFRIELHRANKGGDR